MSDTHARNWIQYFGSNSFMQASQNPAFLEQAYGMHPDSRAWAAFFKDNKAYALLVPTGAHKIHVLHHPDIQLPTAARASWAARALLGPDEHAITMTFDATHVETWANVATTATPTYEQLAPVMGNGGPTFSQIKVNKKDFDILAGPPFVLIPPNVVEAILEVPDTGGLDPTKLARAIFNELNEFDKEDDAEEEEDGDVVSDTGSQLKTLFGRIIQFCWAAESAVKSFDDAPQWYADSRGQTYGRELAQQLLKPPSTPQYAHQLGTDVNYSLKLIADSFSQVASLSNNTRGDTAGGAAKGLGSINADVRLAFLRASAPTAKPLLEPTKLQDNVVSLLNASSAMQAITNLDSAMRSKGQPCGIIGRGHVLAIRMSGPQWQSIGTPLGFTQFAVKHEAILNPSLLNEKSGKLVRAARLKTDNEGFNQLEKSEVSFLLDESLSQTSTGEEYGIVLKAFHALTEILFGADSIMTTESAKWKKHFKTDREYYTLLRLAKPDAFIAIQFLRDLQTQNFLRHLVTTVEWKDVSYETFVSENAKLRSMISSCQFTYSVPTTLLAPAQPGAHKRTQDESHTEEPALPAKKLKEVKEFNPDVPDWRVNGLTRKWTHLRGEGVDVPKIGNKPICLRFYANGKCQDPRCGRAHIQLSAISAADKETINTFFAARFAS